MKDKVIFLKTHDDTGGEYSLLHVEALSGTGPPLHYHKIMEQTFKVISGELKLKVRDTVYTLKAGDVHVVPPMVPHAESSTPGKLLLCDVEIRPAHKGYEKFMNYTYNSASQKYTEDEEADILANTDTYKP